MINDYELISRQAVMKGPLESLFCCIGDPVVGNPTQLMMEASFRSMLFSARYLTCTVSTAQLAGALEGIRSLGFAGANVTAPHKVAVIKYLDDVTVSARLSKAVNCITRRADGTYIGDNTDGKGFLTSIEEIRSVKGMHVLVIGAGGAARAIVTELALNGASHITIANRTLRKAHQIVDDIGEQVDTQLECIEFDGSLTIASDYDLVVQATSVGLFYPQGGFDLVWESTKQKQQIAADVVFNPIYTRFLQDAKQSGATIVDGLGMLVYQGAIAIEQWTKKHADCEIMRKALEEAFTI